MPKVATSGPNHITPLPLRSNTTLSKIPTQQRILFTEPQTGSIVVHGTVSVKSITQLLLSKGQGICVLELHTWPTKKMDDKLREQ